MKITPIIGSIFLALSGFLAFDILVLPYSFMANTGANPYSVATHMLTKYEGAVLAAVMGAVIIGAWTIKLIKSHCWLSILCTLGILLTASHSASQIWAARCVLRTAMEIRQGNPSSMEMIREVYIHPAKTGVHMSLISVFLVCGAVSFQHGNNKQKKASAPPRD